LIAIFILTTARSNETRIVPAVGLPASTLAIAWALP
jgi:hypothetical protein